MAAAIALMPVCISAAADKSQPFTVAISASQETVKIGEEIRVHVVLTNVSSEPLFVRRSPNPAEAEMHYTVLFRDKNGKDASETKYGRAVRKHELVIVSDAAIVLDPGQKLEEDTDLHKLFEITSPGEYEVEFSRHVDDDPNNEIVKSNRITITVTE
jgi:hypothetical protein